MKPRIVLVTGYWSTNIGNSFLQLGGEGMLRQAYPEHEIFSLADQPGYLNPKAGNPSNALLLLEHVEMDYLVLLGPFMRPEFPFIWADTLGRLCRKGVRLIMLGVGMMDYSPAAIGQYRAWLSATPPYILMTRDERTFESLQGIASHAYSGIDPSFFLPDRFRPLPVDLGDYLILNFDKRPEPRIEITDSTYPARSGDYAFEFAGRMWSLRFPRWRTALSRRLKWYPFVDAYWPSRYPELIDRYRVIRTDHRFNPLLLRKVYKGPGGFASDVPSSYLALYAGASLTLTNRVHACAAALAYGRPAMLFSDTPRVGLLQRVGAERITQEPTQVSLELLAGEKQAMIRFLQQTPLA